MLRSVIVIIFLCAGFGAFSQDAFKLEPTSATDGGVKLQKTKKFRFQKSTRASKTENHGEPVKPLRYKAEVRETEHHGGTVKPARYKAEARETEHSGKSYRKNRSSKKLNGASRVYKKHGASASTSSPSKSKVRRSLGRD